MVLQMNFNINDLKEFTLSEEEVVCTTSFVKPIHIVLASNIKLYSDKKFRFKYQTPLEYAINMRYHNPLEIDTIDGANHSKAIKLQDTFDDDQQVTKVMNILKNNNYLDNETINTLQMIIAEIFQNFYAHADFDKPPICCVQDWPASNFIEIAIADKGIGIARSLEKVLENYPAGTNPCNIACQNGVSSKLHETGRLGTNHSGYGLFYTKRFIEENNGMLYLMSLDNCYVIKNGMEYDEKLPYKWVGTAIRLIINKSKTVNGEEFCKGLAKEQDGEDYEDFF